MKVHPPTRGRQRDCLSLLETCSGRLLVSVLMMTLSRPFRPAALPNSCRINNASDALHAIKKVQQMARFFRCGDATVRVGRIVTWQFLIGAG